MTRAFQQIPRGFLINRGKLINLSFQASRGIANELALVSKSATCRQILRGKSYFAADSRWIRAASNFIRLVSRPGTRTHTCGSDVCSKPNCTVSCKHTYEPATRVYGLGYYLLPGRDINHGYPCGVSASTFCIKRNETQRNGCLRKGNSLGYGELCVVTGGENWNSWAKKLYFSMFRTSKECSIPVWISLSLTTRIWHLGEIYLRITIEH